LEVWNMNFRNLIQMNRFHEKFASTQEDINYVPYRIKCVCLLCKCTISSWISDLCQSGRVFVFWPISLLFRHSPFVVLMLLLLVAHLLRLSCVISCRLILLLIPCHGDSCLRSAMLVELLLWWLVRSCRCIMLLAPCPRVLHQSAAGIMSLSVLYVSVLTMSTWWVLRLLLIPVLVLSLLPRSVVLVIS